MSQKGNLIFLHGFPLNGKSWKPQVEHFKNQWNVLTPDLRGHGMGVVGEGSGPWLIAHYAEDLKKFMDQNNIQEAVLCGLSMGGYVALEFMSQYPRRVSKLILCDTQAGADSNEAKDKRYVDIEKLMHGSLAGFAQGFLKKVLSEKTQKENPELSRHLEDLILGNKKEKLAMVLSALASRKDSTAMLSTISVPTLVVVGSEDKVTTPEVNKKMAQAIVGSEFKLIEGAGHFSNLEQPQAFNSIVNTFLEGH